MRFRSTTEDAGGTGRQQGPPWLDKGLRRGPPHYARRGREAAGSQSETLCTSKLSCLVQLCQWRQYRKTFDMLGDCVYAAPMAR
ncbi:hypothetical protein cyc_02823 [Cyclospora cayetanensis]|uniref:Uncharacterized protein n=1 Tax=Cyclospora cayetanensis TaxID=88456 RepID=A0A1D3D307_9EIME|nr:hypothetical protein cyc_02823 [Cyclospora cayetanensis]